MPDICLYFQVHQPYRLRRYEYSTSGPAPALNEQANRDILRPVADESICREPGTTRAVERSGGQFRLPEPVRRPTRPSESDAPDVESFQGSATGGGAAGGFTQLAAGRSESSGRR
jgi:hypothetical protein